MLDFRRYLINVFFSYDYWRISELNPELINVVLNLDASSPTKPYTLLIFEINRLLNSEN